MSNKPLLKNRVYDFAKDATTIYIPALAVLYAALAAIWGWSYAVEVTTSAAAVVVFLGAVLKISSNQYAKTADGFLIANDPNPEADTYRFEVSKNPAELANKNEVRLKVIDLLPRK